MTFVSVITLFMLMVLVGNTCYEVGKTVGRDKQRQMCSCCCGDDEDEEQEILNKKENNDGNT